MNPRIYNDESRYYSLDPPWVFAHRDAFTRIFQLHTDLNRIKDCMRGLEKIRDQVLQDDIGDLNWDRRSDVKIFIRELMESAEVFRYCFDELNEARWFGTFTQDIAHAYWRIEDGRFNDIRSDDEQFLGLLGEAERILDHGSKSHGVVNRLDTFLEQYSSKIYPGDVSDKYSADVFEARDLYCLGYYSTSLLVLGRAIEKALLELGEVRNVNSVHAYNQEQRWEDTRFSFRVNALRHIDLPGRHGKMLSKREYHLASILVDYRNNVAHSEYDEIGRDQAERQILESLDLLNILTDRISYLKDYEKEIPEVNGQTAQ